MKTVWGITVTKTKSKVKTIIWPKQPQGAFYKCFEETFSRKEWDEMGVTAKEFLQMHLVDGMGKKLKSQN